jgi:hypothetical protein
MTVLTSMKNNVVWFQLAKETDASFCLKIY